MENNVFAALTSRYCGAMIIAVLLFQLKFDRHIMLKDKRKREIENLMCLSIIESWLLPVNLQSNGTNLFYQRKNKDFCIY